MIQQQRRVFTILSLLWLSIPQIARAEYSVVFSDVTVEQGETFEVDVEIASETNLGGLLIPFRWTSPDIAYLGAVFHDDVVNGTLVFQRFTAVPGERRSGFLIRPSLTPGEIGWIPFGRQTIVSLRFRVSDFADDQVVIIDSAMTMLGDIILEQVQFSDFGGTTVIFPTVTPGTIRIGSPPPVTLEVSPSTILLNGSVGGETEIADFLITSTGGVDIEWDAEWSQLWLEVAPALGRTPAVPSAIATMDGLIPGEYVDTIRLRSFDALNSPVLLPVVLTVDSTAAPDDDDGPVIRYGPNPFVTYHDPETNIYFTLPDDAYVTIDVYNVLGQHVRAIVAEQMSPGTHMRSWDGRMRVGRAASGHYFYRISIDGEVQTKRLILIK